MSARSCVHRFGPEGRGVHAQFVRSGKIYRYIIEKARQLMIAKRVQIQYFDCVRMIQLIEESKGWDETATYMKQHLENRGLHEDEDGHYPRFLGSW